MQKSNYVLNTVVRSARKGVLKNKCNLRKNHLGMARTFLKINTNLYSGGSFFLLPMASEIRMNKFPFNGHICFCRIHDVILTISFRNVYRTVLHISPF
jgi:hypothetical protein